jgi:hypothetical protein
MKSVCIIALFLLGMSFSSYGLILSDININSFTKESLSNSQVRFVSKLDNTKIHLQTNKFESFWNEKTLKEDLEEMYKTRRSMYELVGFSNVIFNEHKLSQYQNHQMLTIKGEYKNPANQNVHFIELNIYFKKQFLQIKIINDKEKIDDKYVEAILKQLPIDKMDL